MGNGEDAPEIICRVDTMPKGDVNLHESQRYAKNEREAARVNNNWERFGDEIRKTVQDAVENQDYDRLNQMISETIYRAIDVVADNVKRAQHRRYGSYREYQPNYEYKQVTKESPKRDANTTYEYGRQMPAPIMTNPPSKAGTIAATAVGYAVGGLTFLGFLGNQVAGMLNDMFFGMGPMFYFGFFDAISIALMLGGFVVGIAGTRKLFKIGRFKKYIAAIGQKEYCNIPELAAKVGKSKKFVVKDVESMMNKGWFLQGHLDKQKTTLMVTDKMYNQYCQLEEQKAFEEKEAKEREARQQKMQEEQTASRKDLSPEVQKMIEQGDAYVRKIRACNDAIPGEEISEKIYHMEMLVDKIFDRVEQEPKCVSDIQRLMNYYLPTTVKLLDAYAEMDAQPVGGENIQNAKREIEATLDTLNVAFEKLLDSLFQEKAWDVSSDISVLNTMLAQEGLKDDGLKTK